MEKTSKIIGSVVLILALCGCVAGSGDSEHAASGSLLSQFLLGVWHGLVSPVTLIGEVINVLAPHVLPWSVRMYETKGTGVLYDVGFYIGLAGSPIIVGGRMSRPRRVTRVTTD